MYIVGVDIGKNNHEATGHYWLSLYLFLLTKGYEINVINYIQSDSFRNLYIRKTKNDTKDSFIIAEVIRFGKFTNTKLCDDKLLALRQLCRYKLSLTTEISELKCRIITVLDQIFPEYDKLFSDIWGASSKAVLEKCQTPEGILELDINDLTELLKTKSKGKLGFNKAEEIQNAAKNTFGIKIAKKAFKFQIKQLISQVLFLEKQMKFLDSEIEFYYSQFDCHLTTIPGIDPTVKQSGQFLSNKNKISKRGSPYLRRALFLSASTCVLHDSPLNEYYNKK